MLKISLDGPPESHDAMRGTGSFEKALAGATAARDAGVKVEFTCTVGQHNAHTIEPLIDIASAVSIPVVFQPALNSLFLDSIAMDHPGRWMSSPFAPRSLGLSG